MRKFFSSLLALIVFLLITHNSSLITPAYAEGEFETSYNVTYEVSEDGSTSVTEGITLKNLTDRFYASNFSLIISATNISEVQAFDSRGNLPVQVSTDGQKTKIDVQFNNQQITGKGRQYDWTLKFKSSDFAQKLNKVWQVTIPKLSTLKDVSNYNLTLVVPVSLGDPSSIQPEPKSQSETGGKINFHFDKQQLAQSGVVADFGHEQLVNFELEYKLNNTGLLPAIKEISLPSDTSYQEVLINEITPNPETVYVDNDGNYIALFKVDRSKNQTVKVVGTAKLYIRNLYKVELSPEEYQNYLSKEKFWDKDSPLVKAKLNEIFKDKNPTTNKEKAQLIYDFVVNNLSFDLKRAHEQNYQRLGALTVLNNPDQALSTEFVDLFVTLTRAAGIPSRMLIGKSHSANTALRPFAFQGENLHVWAEYYDPNLGWMRVDPAWGNSSGGVDYFSQFDPNHLVVAKRGNSSTQPQVPDQINLSYNGDNFDKKYSQSLEIVAPNQIYASFPAQAKVIVTNTGNSATSSATLEISAARLQILGSKTRKVSGLPPFGKEEYKFDLRTGSSVVDAYEDILQAKLANLVSTKLIVIKPFFAANIFAPIIISILALMVIVYGVILGIHLKPNLIKQKNKK